MRARVSAVKRARALPVLPVSQSRPENLELWTRPQPKGVRTDDAVAWAREIIARYGDEIPPKEKGGRPAA